MTTNTAKALKELGLLKATLIEANIDYKVRDTPTLSDGEYDKIKHRYLELYESVYGAEPEVPVSMMGVKFGDDTITGFHKYPMLSLANTFGLQDIEDRVKRYKLPAPYVVEDKLDGVSLSLEYDRDGMLDIALTRGDGEVGEDVTHLIGIIDGIPQYLDYTFDTPVIVRGEVVVSKPAFKAVNASREKEGLKPYASPRSLVSGAIGLKNPVDGLGLGLRFVAFKAICTHPDFPETRSGAIRLLAKTGFHVVEKTTCKSLSTIDLVLRDDLSKKLYACDGKVIKVDNVNAFNESARLISSSEGPIDEFAFKYAEKEYHSTLSSIDYQVGRTGQITPVFKIAPTVIDGATVTNATMHNLAELKDKNPKVGGKVVLKRAGEVIPYIVDVERADKPIAVPEHCPCCAQPLTTKGRLSFCTNKRGCKEQQFQMLCHFVSRHAMDIDGMGPSIIRLLLEKEHLQVPADIYQLTQSTIQALSGYGEKSAKKLIDAINASRAVNVDKFIYALGIDEIGRVSAMKLSEHFKGDIAAIRTATKDQLLAINDFGKVMAEAVVTYFEQQQGLDELLAEVSLHRTALVTSDKYKGQTLVITGSFADKTREDVAQAFIMGGAKVTKSVSKNTTFILVGDNPSQSKLDKAKALGVPRVYEF